MSIANVQHTQNDGGGSSLASLSQAFASNVAAGNLLICVVRVGGTAASAAITDSQGNTWNNLTFRTRTNVGGVQISWAVAGSSAACTVTVTPNVSASIRMAIAEYSGADSSPFDVEGGGNGNSTSLAASANITPSFANELIIAAGAVGVFWTFTVGASFSIIEHVPAAPNTKLAMEHWIQTTATATNGPMTISSADDWVDCVAAFKPTGAAPPPVTAPDLTPGAGGTAIPSFIAVPW